jgi:two-component system, OmpR family, response regulator
MATSKVLIVEDDQTLLQVLSYNLNREGYAVVTAADGVQALETARQETPDLIVLDVMLPHLDGFEVCRILRKHTNAPVIMLTARTEEGDKVVGLEIGADDYLTKPFSMRELLARIKALLRRSEMLREEIRKESPGPVLKAGELELELDHHQAFRGGVLLNLSPREFDLLAFLASNKKRVFSRDTLLEKVWGYNFAGDTRTVDVHIRWLRQKIEEDPAHPRHLVTVRGVGYKLED